MAIISRLAVLLGLDAGEFNAGLGKAKDKVEGFSLGAKIGMAAVATAFYQAGKSAVEYADQISDVAKANDLAIHTVLALNQAMIMNGGNTESASKMMSGFSKVVEEAYSGNDKLREMFNQIGISNKELANLNTKELLEKTLKALNDTEPAIKRNGEAMKFFGRAVKGTDLKGVYEDYSRLKDKFNESDEAFSKIKIGVDGISDAWLEFKNNFITTFAPALNFIIMLMRELVFIISDGIKASDKLLHGDLKGFNKVYEDRDKWEEEHKKKMEDAIRLAKEGSNIKGAGGVLPASEESKKQSESLKEQILLLQQEARQVGQIKSEYTKLTNQFNEHGKYAKASNQEKYDAAVAAYEVDKKNQEFYFENAHRVSDIEKERLKFQAQMAGFSDLEQKNLLAEFDEEYRLQELRRQGVVDEVQAAKMMADFKSKQNQEKETLKAQQTFSAGWSKAYNDWVEESKNSAALGKQAFENMTTSLSNALSEFVKTGKLNFKSLIGDMIKQLITLKLQAQMSGLFGMLGKSLGFGGGGSSDAGMFTGSTGEIGGSILGGPHAGGGEINAPSLVGEAGPELFIPKSAGTIIPNNRLSSMMGNTPSVVYNGPYIASLSAIDTQSATQFLASNKQAVWSANQSAQRSLPQSR